MEEGSDNIKKESKTEKEKPVESKKIQGTIFCTHYFQVLGILFVYYCFDTTPLEGDTKNEKTKEGSDNIKQKNETAKGGSKEKEQLKKSRSRARKCKICSILIFATNLSHNQILNEPFIYRSG